MKKITSRKWKTAAKGIVLNMVYILLCFIALVPILYALNVSLSGKGAGIVRQFIYNGQRILHLKTIGQSCLMSHFYYG